MKEFLAHFYEFFIPFLGPNRNPEVLTIEETQQSLQASHTNSLPSECYSM